MAMMMPTYHYHVFRSYQDGDHDEGEQGRRLRPKPRPTDLFNPHISVCYKYLSTTTPSRTLYQLIFNRPTSTIACQSFFGQEGEHYLHTKLSQLRFFTHERLQRMIPGIRREVQRVFGINDNDDMMMMSDAASSSGTTNVESSSNEEPPREVRFSLVFEFEVQVDHVEGNVVEQTMSGVVGMDPASEEAMLTLLRKPNKALEREQHCTICMEGYDDDDDGGGGGGGGSEACAMPCDHVFHRQCIVQWLRTSHVCPLCLYAMPTV